MLKISLVMGSQSDWSTLKHTSNILNKLNIKHEKKIISAHRTPKRLYDFAEKAYENKIKIIIAGAGGSAHLPGMIAAISHIPVIGVPIKSRNSIDGWDSILSILQMPGGVPVATVALNGSKNAGILAAQIIGSFDSKVSNKVKAYKKDLENKVLESSKDLKNRP